MVFHTMAKLKKPQCDAVESVHVVVNNNPRDALLCFSIGGPVEPFGKPFATCFPTCFTTCFTMFYDVLCLEGIEEVVFSRHGPCGCAHHEPQQPQLGRGGAQQRPRVPSLRPRELRIPFSLLFQSFSCLFQVRRQRSSTGTFEISIWTGPRTGIWPASSGTAAASEQKAARRASKRLGSKVEKTTGATFSGSTRSFSTRKTFKSIKHRRSRSGRWLTCHRDHPYPRASAGTPRSSAVGKSITRIASSAAGRRCLRSPRSASRASKSAIERMF